MDEEIRYLNRDLERRVGERTAELAAKNEELEDFTFSIANELQAPLRQIQDDCRVLAQVPLDPEPRRSLEHLTGRSRKMAALIADLLHLFKIGRQQVKVQTALLNSLVEGTLRDLQPEMHDRDIQWQIADLPTAECDPILVRQVFEELLSNALKCTKGRKPAVIEAGKKNMNGETVIFVKDNGVGFDVNYADRLFGAFQHIEGHESEGSGLGLAIVKRIVQKHGGRVWANAEVDRGATFYFTLGIPAQPAPELVSVLEGAR
jgi:light-regulated signal transduction histidine kinase (bacteriophytochrome)